MLNTKLLSGTAAAPKQYVDDVFSTYLYTGNGTTQTITNGIDLAGKGGLVWLKTRSGTTGHLLFDTPRGTGNFLRSNTTGSSTASTDTLTAFNSNGFNLGADVSPWGSNQNTATYCSWTFRKQAKFMDVVTYTGDGGTGPYGLQTINHNLGSTPGMIIVKSTSSADDWAVYHNSTIATNPANYILYLNQSTARTNVGVNIWNPTSTTFTTVSSTLGQTYVVYLFAHNAGGFGAAGTDNVISCGSATTDASLGEAIVNLGYEPQFVLLKNSQTAGYDWEMADNMRGIATLASSNMQRLRANLANAETTASFVELTSTGFKIKGGFGASQNVIYMAIRRPMKPPTSGTEVFSPIIATPSAGTKITTDFLVDLQISRYRAQGTNPAYFADRLRGVSTTDTDGGRALTSTSTAAEVTTPAVTRGWDNTGFKTTTYYADLDPIYYNFRRATGFMDVVCFSGTGVARTVAHNLGAVPELMIVKRRDSTAFFPVYVAALEATKYLGLNVTNAVDTFSGIWNNTSPTTTLLTVGTDASVNANGGTYVAYLFVTLAGISKVGSYTGNGSSQTINCGFTAGARFVMIKRTDLAGAWYVWDTARGIVSGNDPHLSLNTTAAEVTTNDSVDPDNSGFIVNQLAATNINVTSATYIYLAIA